MVRPCSSYINDIPEGIRSTIRLFADDTIAYLTISSDADAQHLQNDLDKLAEWETNWKMSFHPDKCNLLTISRKAHPIKTSYSLHGHVLESVSSAKYLGCTLNSELRWNEHITNICNKANKTIGFLKRNLNISSRTVKENAYKSLVRPTVEYASTVWDPYTKSDIDRIEMVQRRGARFVTNTPYSQRGSISEKIDQMKCKSLQQRRKDARLTMFYKIVNDKVAIGKEDRLIPPARLTKKHAQ